MYVNNNISGGAHSYHGSFIHGRTSPSSAINCSGEAGVNALNNQDASTAVDIQSESDMNVTNDSTTNVDHQQRKDDHTSTLDQYTAPYGSSTPNTDAHDGQDTYPDAGAHSYPNGPEITTGYSFTPYPFHFPMPGCFPQMHPGATLYPSSQPYPFMYNNNLPAGLNPYIHSALFYCSNVGLFNDWVHTLVHHLQTSGLKDLVPDAHDHTIREPTPVETQGLISLFCQYVLQQSYPKCVNDCYKKQMHPYDIIRHAVVLDMQRSNINAIINTISSLQYNGAYPAYQFTSYLHNMRDKLNPVDLQNYGEILKQSILKTLHGTYEYIAKRFFLSESDYTLSDIFSAIQRDYLYYHQNSKIYDSLISKLPCATHDPTNKKSSMQNININNTGQPSQPNNNSVYKLTTASTSIKTRPKYHNTKSKKVSQVKTINHSTHSTRNACIDPTILRPVSTTLNPDHFMLLDSGATVTLVKHKEMLHNIHTSHPDSIQITSCSNTNSPFSQEGDLVIQTLNGKHVTLHAFYTPTIDHTILSTSDLRSHNLFLNERLNIIEDKDGSVAANIVSYNGLHWLSNYHIVFPKSTPSKTINALRTKFPLAFIHCIFGHVNVNSIYQSLKNYTFQNISLEDVDWYNSSKFPCADCMQGKSRKRPHIVGSRLQYQHVFLPFQYIHSDLFDPVNLGTKPQWFISFTDESSKFKWTYLLKKKDDMTILHILKSFIATIHRQFHTDILKFQFDRGSEYTNTAVRNYLEENGINIIYTTTGDSQAHGVAERLNLTLLNDCRTLMHAAKVPQHLWYYAVQYATLMRNSIYNVSMKASPRSKVGLLGLDAKSILPFGQQVILHLPKTSSKLHIRGEKGITLVPDSESYGYLIYLPHKHRVVSSSNYAVVKQDVNLDDAEEYDDSIFDNLINNFISDSEADNTDQLLPENDSPTTLPSSDTSEPTFEDSMSIQNDAAADLHIPLSTEIKGNSILSSLRLDVV